MSTPGLWYYPPLSALAQTQNTTLRLAHDPCHQARVWLMANKSKHQGMPLATLTMHLEYTCWSCLTGGRVLQKVRVLDAYCGCGGMSFMDAHSPNVHVDTAWAIDYSPSMTATFKVNYPHAAVGFSESSLTIHNLRVVMLDMTSKGNSGRASACISEGWIHKLPRSSFETDAPVGPTSPINCRPSNW